MARRTEEWAKLIGATLHDETDTVLKFKFGSQVCQAGKTVSKIDGDDIYVRAWVALKNMDDWDAEFAPHTTNHKNVKLELRVKEPSLKPSVDIATYDRDQEIRELLRKALALLRDTDLT